MGFVGFMKVVEKLEDCFIVFRSNLRDEQLEISDDVIPTLSQPVQIANVERIRIDVERYVGLYGDVHKIKFILALLEFEIVREPGLASFAHAATLHC